MNGGKLILSLEIVEMVISLIIIGLCLLQIKSGTGLGTIAGTEVELTTITPKEVGWERVILFVTIYLLIIFSLISICLQLLY